MAVPSNPVTLEGSLEGATPLKLWLKHVASHKFIYLLGALSVVATDIAEVALPKLIQWTIDALTLGSLDFEKYFILFIGVLLFQLAGRVIWRQTLGQQTHFVAARFKSHLWNRARYFPRSRLESDLSPGELMNVATGDVGIARFAFGFTLVGTLDFLSLIILTVAAMLTISVELTLWTLLILPLLPVVLDKLARRENLQHKEAQEKLSALTDLATQAVSTVRLQRLTQTDAFWERRLLHSAEDYRGDRLSVVKTSLAFIPFTGIAPLISYAILVGLGVDKVFRGELSIGAFVAMQSYIFMIQVPLFELGTLISEWQRGIASLERITNTLNQPEAHQLRAGGERLSRAPLVYKISSLSFNYPDTQKEVLKDLNFEIRAGSRLGIMGPVGTGKSTLAQILAGFERNYKGSVELFGKDIRTYAHNELRKLIAVVPQKPFLFADSIRNNLSLKHSYSDQELWEFLEIAGVARDVKGLKNQLDTKLGEWGINLSGGQKQRLTLARALAVKPQILILDDCLSAVDTVTEEHILQSLNEGLKNTTLIWIAHRESTLRYCDTRLELKNSDLGSS